MKGWVSFVLLVAVAVAQSTSEPGLKGGPAPDARGNAATAEAAAKTASASTATDTSPGKVVVPAGTKILLQLQNAITTKTVEKGDGVYAVTTFPITQDNKIVIPAGTFVQGMVTSARRPGRVKGRAELLVHFTTMIFPSGYTVTLPGAVDTLSGAEQARVSDAEGRIKAEGTKANDAKTIGKVGATGAGVGAAVGRGAKGAMVGGGIGLAAGAIITLFTRGQEIRIENGTALEMVLQRPLELEEERVSGGGTSARLVPVQQRRPMAPPR